MQRITEDHAEHYREHGYAIVENFLTEAELAGALDELKHVLPGWVEYCLDPSQPKPEHWRNGRRPMNVMAYRFPFPGTHLNAITHHPDLIELASHAAGGSEMFCEQSHLSFK